MRSGLPAGLHLTTQPRPLTAASPPAQSALVPCAMQVTWKLSYAGPANCSEAGWAGALGQLDAAHFLVSSGGPSGAAQAVAAAPRIIFFAESLPTPSPLALHAFEIPTPPSLAAASALRAMFLQAGVTRIAVTTRSDAAHGLVAACLGTFAELPSLRQLQPSATLLPVNYTSANVTAVSGFYTKLVSRLFGASAEGQAGAQPEALIACDDAVGTQQIAAALSGLGRRLPAQFLYEAPSSSARLPDGTDETYTLSALQWDAGAQLADPYFGAAASYPAAYAAALTSLSLPDTTTSTPEAAAASASALILALAVKAAFAGCTVDPAVVAAGDTRRMLGDPSVLNCTDDAVGGGGAAVNGTLRILRQLRGQRFETFYGPVGLHSRILAAAQKGLLVWQGRGSEGYRCSTHMRQCARRPTNGLLHCMAAAQRACHGSRLSAAARAQVQFNAQRRNVGKPMLVTQVSLCVSFATAACHCRLPLLATAACHGRLRLPRPLPQHGGTQAGSAVCVARRAARVRPWPWMHSGPC
jgi:hypothetical protein